MTMIKSRFTPSPTGYIHIGNLRTALFSFLYGKSACQPPQGQFLLRIEDTDLARSKETYCEQLYQDLGWLGITWQEGPNVEGPDAPYFQSQRGEIYEDYYQQMLDNKQAYWCFCSEKTLELARKAQIRAGHPPRYEGTCRHLTPEQIESKINEGLKPALRFKIPDVETIEYTDLVQGLKVFKSQDIGDFIVKKNDGTASFMFCNAVDDSLMGVTHVIRGDDHLTNTPRQLAILKTLALRAPEYAHSSLILGSDGKPLSKRNGSQSVIDLKKQGYFPLTIANYLARIGHHYEEDKLLSLEQLSAAFDLNKISKSPSRFDLAQLSHWQKEVIMQQSDDEISDWMTETMGHQIPDEKKSLFVKTIRENVLVLQDVQDWIERLFDGKVEDDGVLKAAGESYFIAAIEAVKSHGLDHKAVFNSIKEQEGVKGKALFMPMRVAISGVTFGPQMPELFELLGQDAILRKLENAKSSS